MNPFYRSTPRYRFTAHKYISTKKKIFSVARTHNFKLILLDGESGEALRGVGKTVVESYNFLTKLNTKYGLTGKVTDSIGKAISGIEVESEALQKVTSTYSTVSSKVSELNQEYDLVSKGKEVIAATAALSDAAIDKVIELNEKVCL